MCGVAYGKQVLKCHRYMSGFGVGPSESDSARDSFYRAAILHQHHTDIMHRPIKEDISVHPPTADSVDQNAMQP